MLQFYFNTFVLKSSVQIVWKMSVEIIIQVLILNSKN